MLNRWRLSGITDLVSAAGHFHFFYPERRCWVLWNNTEHKCSSFGALYWSELCEIWGCDIDVHQHFIFNVSKTPDVSLYQIFKNFKSETPLALHNLCIFSVLYIIVQMFCSMWVSDVPELEKKKVWSPLLHSSHVRCHQWLFRHYVYK